MKRLIVTLALTALLIPTGHVVARDANRDALAAAEKTGQIQGEKERERLINVERRTIHVPKNNSSQDRLNYDAPGLWEPAP